MNSRLWLTLLIASSLLVLAASLSAEAPGFLTALGYVGSTKASDVCGTSGASYGLKCGSNNSLISVNMTTWSSCSENITLPTIPSELANFTASGCLLNGSISTSLAPSLSFLNLSNTNVSGTIPASLTKLVTLDLSGTLVNSSIPSTLTKLSTLILSQVLALQGSIPDTLTNLELLDLSRTNINNGTFNATIPAKLKKLTSLNLANTQTLGAIPSNLTKLVTLNLLNTAVSGDFPEELTKLTYLDISGTGITSVPTSLKQLVELYASSSFIGGDLSWLPSLTALRTFVAAGSRLAWNASYLFAGQNWTRIDLSNTITISTKVPSSFKIGSSLVSLDLSSTYMTGTITSGMFSSASSLQVLRLYNNPKLTGDFTFLAGCPSLVELRLRSSGFKGSLTLNARNLTLVSLSSNKVSSFAISSVGPGAYVDLSKNAIQSGTITTTNLAWLNVSSNQLTSLALSSTVGSLNTLDLSNNYFPSIPSAISDSPVLAFLNMSSNYLTGSIPTVIPSTLVDLDLSNNSLSGYIESGGWGYMKTINLHMNQLSGDVHSFASFAGLVTLQLQDNALSGTLIAPPRSLVTLRAQNNAFTAMSVSLEASDPLEILDVSNNSLSGDLNTIFPTNLTMVRLHDNYLTGSITLAPSMPGLLELRLSNNQLSGSITWPSDAISVRELHLDNNQFSGTLSPALSQCIGLFHLNLSYNQFEGSIPSMIGFYSIVDIDLGFNRLNGSLPDLTNSSVVDISLASNSLTGNIPTSWFITQLRSLDLSQNQLSGALWNSLFQEPMKLRRLNLSRNAFSGTMVPLLDTATLRRLDLSNNTLSKALPQWLRNVTYINVIGNGFATAIPPLDKVRTLLASGNRLDLCASIPSSAPELRNCDLIEQTVCMTKEGCQEAYESFGCSTTYNQTCLPCLSNKPGDGFFCEFGKWVSIGVNTTGAIVTGGGVTVIEGNMTVTNGSIIVISNSTLSVQGCSDLSGNATLVVTETDIDQWTKNRTSAFKTILSSAQGWCSSIPLLSLGVSYPASPCRTVTYHTESTSTAIIVYFSVSNNGCFRWWPIILGVTLGTLILVVLLATFFRVNKNAAQMIWPYMKNDEDLPVFEALEEEHEMRSFLTEPLLTGGSEMDTVDLN